MNISDLIKSNFGSLARWITNVLVVHKLISGNESEQTAAYVVGAITLLWTVVENWWTQRRIPKGQTTPTGVPPVKLSCALLLCALWLGVGCAMNHPVIKTTTYYPDGRREERIVDVRSYALWPATTEAAKQKASISPKLGLSTGSDLIREESASTNSIEALKAIDSILGKIKP
jgi:hypothetical protein